MKTIYLIRHAETEALRDGLLAGSGFDTPLTEEGRSQAKEVGKLLANYEIDTIVSSPMSRTRETAGIIATVIGYKQENIQLNKLFVERSYGPYEKISFKEFVKEYENNNLLDGVETTEELYERVARSFDWLRQLDGERILLVTHGSVGRMIILLSQNKRHDEHKNIKSIGTAEVVELTLD